MSWHTSGILIHADHSKDIPWLLNALGFPKAEHQDETVDFDEATSSAMDWMAVGYVDGWTCAFGNVMALMAEDDAVAEISKSADVFSFHLEGTCGSAGFEWWSGGKALRKWRSMEGEVDINEGKPLAAEKKVFHQEEDDEQRVLLLMEKLTVPFKRLAKTSFDVYACDD